MALLKHVAVIAHSAEEEARLLGLFLWLASRLSKVKMR
jgi:hypothetical protein